MRIRKSLRDCVDGYLWEDHWKRLERREYGKKFYAENYKSEVRHVVRNAKPSDVADCDSSLFGSTRRIHPRNIY